jgi:hypothetical protein
MHAAPVEALLTPRALLAHLVAAALVWLLVLDLERVLAAAIAAVRAARRAMAIRGRRAPSPPAVVLDPLVAGSQAVLGRAPSRGPPLLPIA